jgi:hypothetical protein
MARRLSVSGYCLKDLYDSLHASFACRDLERACCLAAELACTPGELGTLLGHLVDVYARWYVCGNLWLAERLLCLLSTADADAGRSRSKVRDGAGRAEARKALCEMVILIGSQRRRDGEELWRKRGGHDEHDGDDHGSSSSSNAEAAASCFFDDADLPREFATHVRAVRAKLARRQGHDAMAAAAALLRDRASSDAERLENTKLPSNVAAELKRMPKLVRHDAVWHVWAQALDAAVSLGSDHTSLVTALLRLHALRCSKRQRDSRLNLLYYALYSCCRRSIRSDGPSEQLAATLQRGRDRIDDVYDEILSARHSGGDPGGEVARKTETGLRRQRDKPSYLSCVTTYDDVARCELADDIREVRSSSMSDALVKHICVRDSRAASALPTPI